MGVGEIFLVMGQTPFGVYRPASGHNTGHAVRRERYVREPYAGMDGEIIDALLGLFNERITVNLPGEVLSLSPTFLQCLLVWDGPTRVG